MRFISVKKIKILYISDVVPASLNAGYVLMHRHIERLAKNNQVFAITEDNPKLRHLEMACEGIRLNDQSQNIPRRILAKLGLEPLWFFLRARDIENKGLSIAEIKKPDIILSVWSSPFFLAAFQTAKRKKIPFIVIIHDDWQEMINKKQWSKSLLTQPLRNIFHKAKKRVCISRSTAMEFQKKYGSATCEILPPIPSKRHYRPQIESHSGPLRIATFGELMGNIKVLNAVADVLGETGSTLTFFSHGESAERQELAKRPFVTDGGSLGAEELIQYLASNFDVILIPQSFEPEHRHLVQKCFPSKIPEACQIGLPILMIGPDYGTAYIWAKEVMAPTLVLCSLDSSQITAAIHLLKHTNTRKEAQELVWKAQESYDPEILHNNLEKILNQAAEQTDHSF